MREGLTAALVHQQQRREALALRTNREENNKADLHLYLRSVDLLSNSFNDANHNILQAFPLGVVVKDQVVSFLSIGAAKRRRPHPGIDGAQVIMESVQVLRIHERNNKSQRK